MSFEPRPCAHCGSAHFHVVPGVQLEVWQAMGAASAKITGGRRWSMTLVVCAHCGRTETFTTNGPELASMFRGSQQVTTTRTH
ncbi:MAG: hypothetical protein KF729_12365 [Sandaracinaceae bacterium]|nr:hypothetical protein [Sandaracinaceae bacterium]